MTIYDELVARGLIAQVTDEEEIKELINTGKATFYIGFESYSRFTSCRSFYGFMSYEEITDGRQQTCCIAWWWNRIHR